MRTYHKFKCSNLTPDRALGRTLLSRIPNKGDIPGLFFLFFPRSTELFPPFQNTAGGIKAPTGGGGEAKAEQQTSQKETKLMNIK